MKRKPEEELIDLTTEATPWKKTGNKTPGGTSVQPKENSNSPVGSSQRNRNSPAVNAGQFNPKNRNFLWEVAKETLTPLP